ncbi:MAG: efflux RND transporter periplasmic adaptor subunit [Kiloniellaceae bacterium]
MSSPSTALLKRLLIVPPVAVGIGLVVLLTGRNEPERAEPTEVPHPVRVIEVQPADFVPRALGYGYVEPGSVWEATAEVAGKIVRRHPDLERGRVLEAGTVILRIDPADYELAVAQIESTLDSVAAQLEELAVRRNNTRASLKIERRALTLAEADLERKKALLAKGNASQASVDQAESAVLTQRQKVQELENQLSLMPTERRMLEASAALNRAQLREAELNLERTAIRLPFDARIAEVAVEATQYVAVNQKLVVADSIDVAEVSAQLAIDQVRTLVEPGADISSLSTQDLSTLPQRWGLSAEVRLVAGDLRATWEARFDRLSATIDPQTRTVGLIVAVDQPYRKIIPGRRPPLIKNMYVEVELRAAPRHDRIVVPRVAVRVGRDGRPAVHVADGNNRLVVLPVELGAVQGDLAVVEHGLSGGERVVVSDLVPAIDGMLLAPRRDNALAARLLAQARGEASVR